MNTYIQARINSMPVIVKTFGEYCVKASVKDNDKADKEEKRTLTRIKRVSKRFTRDLNRILGQENEQKNKNNVPIRRTT